MQTVLYKRKIPTNILSFPFTAKQKKNSSTAYTRKKGKRKFENYLYT